jgi:hypothetical protein
MTKYVHIVYVHPVENGEPNLYKVEHEKEFDTQRVAELYVESYNEGATVGGNMFKAVYLGRVNDATGELE